MDREKVIKGLKLCEIGTGAMCYEKECPYYRNGCTEGLKDDILALLKEQETVKPEVYFVGPDQYRFYRCPVCKTAWFYKGKYCPECGRTVKWDAY